MHFLFGVPRMITSSYRGTEVYTRPAQGIKATIRLIAASTQQQSRTAAEWRNHVWPYEFIEAETHDGRKLRLLTPIDEFTRECLTIRVARRLKSIGGQ